MVGALCPHVGIKDKSFGQLLRMLTFAAYLKKVCSRQDGCKSQYCEFFLNQY